MINSSSRSPAIQITLVIMREAWANPSTCEGENRPKTFSPSARVSLITHGPCSRPRRPAEECGEADTARFHHGPRRPGECGAADTVRSRLQTRLPAEYAVADRARFRLRV